MVKRRRLHIDQSPEQSRVSPTVGKSLHTGIPLPPNLSELLHTTCRLAAAEPAAKCLLEATIHDLHRRVRTICFEADVGKLPPIMADDVLHSFSSNGMHHPTSLIPSPRQREGMLFLERKCEDVTWSPPSSPLFPTECIPNDSYAMVDVVQVKNVRNTSHLINSIADFESAEQLGSQLNFAHQQTIREKHNIPIYSLNADVEEKGKCRIVNVGSRIIGEHIEVFSVAEQFWRGAIVASKIEENGNHVLIYFDGVVEHVDLTTKLWRPVT